jgi:hypothetical protein
LEARFNIEALKIFGESKIIIDWLNHRGKLQVASLLGWKDRIRELQTFFRDISFSHIYQDQNKGTDLLSKIALQKQEGKITYNHWIDGHEAPTLFLSLF